MTAPRSSRLEGGNDKSVGERQHRSFVPLFVLSFLSVQWLNDPPVFLKSIFKMYTVMKTLETNRIKPLKYREHQRSRVNEQNTNAVDIVEHLSTFIPCHQSRAIGGFLDRFLCFSPRIMCAGDFEGMRGFKLPLLNLTVFCGNTLASRTPATLASPMTTPGRFPLHTLSFLRMPPKRRYKAKRRRRRLKLLFRRYARPLACCLRRT